ncbi:hypothetical protein T265_00060 [Opisthorchis viverrini]|uniref:Uncharacterized protein n=1 Tax=Opisthorchis viverrini TaxID=6198 RepID=A0A075A772_OPIVI|nr:hypothetical protein T265_00060 [Opisthorchis viverrini]KER34197.1 hypothetical protein T265_00060 [Opisthorchis viverrini]
MVVRLHVHTVSHLDANVKPFISFSTDIHTISLSTGEFVTKCQLHYRFVTRSPSIGELITLHRLRWLGHVLRMPGDRLPRRVFSHNHVKGRNEPEAAKQ